MLQGLPADRRRPRRRSRTRQDVPQMGRRRWRRRPSVSAFPRSGWCTSSISRRKGTRASPAGDREEIGKAFDGFAKQAGPGGRRLRHADRPRQLRRQRARSSICPGPTWRPADFNTQFKKLPTKQIVFVNTTSASGPFVDELSAPGRTIVTATRNGAEQFTTLFGGYFVDALTVEAADADKNKRVSDARGVPVREGGGGSAPTRRRGCSPPSTRCSTTTATRRAAPIRRRPAPKDGKVARGRSSARRADDDGAADRSEAARAVPRAARTGAPRRVAAAAQGEHGPGEIPAELEKLVTDLALKTREIRSREGMLKCELNSPTETMELE